MATENAKTQDEIVKGLFDEVQKRKEALEASAKDNCWKTSGDFRYNADQAHGVHKIAQITDVRKLIDILAFLIDREEKNKTASERLDLPAATFKWLGFTVAEWESDLVLRVNQIMRKEKQRDLEILESRLNAILSPELKRSMELEAIQAMLTK